MAVYRRKFVQIAGTWFFSASFARAATAAAGVQPARMDVRFPQGVASGDPQPDSVMLWTRAEPASPGDVELLLQLGEDESLAALIVEEKVTARPDSDYTVRAHINGLDPARHYYYRFVAADGRASRVGRTMTAPRPGDPRDVNLAFASCQNYEQGFFGAWARMISEDESKPPQEQIQFVLHLGDFIYERYRSQPGKGDRFVRPMPAFPDGATSGKRVWAHTLADYRHLYKTYLSDPHLQAARARWPFICTWDDHEFSNDGFRHFSNYGDHPLSEPQRRRDSNRAWFEYIPALVPDNTDELRIYRDFNWGSRVQLLLTDTRSYRTPPPVPHGLQEKLDLPMLPTKLLDILDEGSAHGGGNPPDKLPFGDGEHPNIARERAPGSMLGAAQKRWFKERLKSSSATWKLWANSLPCLPLRLDLSSLPMQDLHDSVLSDDAWAGFPGEYRELMGFVEDNQIGGLVSLSGDHHAQGAGSLARDDRVEDPRFVAVDFNVTGISSTPQYAGVLRKAQKNNPDFMPLVRSEQDGQPVETWNMSLTQGVLAALAFSTLGWEALSDWLGPNPAATGLKYIDSNSNGYGLARFEASQCHVQLVTVQPPTKEFSPAGAPIHHVASFRLAAWSANEQPRLAGPVFSGTPPFPFA